MKTIFVMRDVLRAMASFEATFEKDHRLSLNEAIVLYTLKGSSEKITATKLSTLIDLAPSHTSKMLRILEEKDLIIRTLGSEDRRKMFFQLSPAGKLRLKELEREKVEIPRLLKPLFP